MTRNIFENDLILQYFEIEENGAVKFDEFTKIMHTWWYPGTHNDIHVCMYHVHVLMKV